MKLNLLLLAGLMPEVEIYTTPLCPYCWSAKKLLRKKGIAFVEIDVAGESRRRAEMVARANGRTSVPQVFLGDLHLGGCDDLYELEEIGKLDRLFSDLTGVAE